MVILGIDPGTTLCGFGVIRKTKKRIKCLCFGVIAPKKSDPPEIKLKKLYLETLKLIRKYKPKVLVVEKLYFFKNLKTAIPVSEAKGVILLAGAQKKVKVLELTPLQVKTAIVGYGRAEKIQVQKMVKKMLNLKILPKPDDAGDALALTLCALRIFPS